MLSGYNRACVCLFMFVYIFNYCSFYWSDNSLMHVGDNPFSKAGELCCQTDAQNNNVLLVHNNFVGYTFYVPEKVYINILNSVAFFCTYPNVCLEQQAVKSSGVTVKFT